MMKRNEGLTLIELIIAISISAMLALGVVQVMRGSVQILDSTNRGANATTIFSVLGSRFRTDVQQAVRVVIASASATSATSCGSWTANNRALITLTDEVVDSDQNSPTYGQPIMNGAAGYEVRTDSASAGSVWRVDCTWDSASSTFTKVSGSDYRLALAVPPPSSTADWNAAISCFGPLGGTTTCATDQFVLVAPNLSLSTTMSQGATGSTVTVANDSSVLLGMQVSVTAAGSTVPSGTFVLSKSQGTGTLTLSKSVTLSGPDVPATLSAYSGLSLSVKSTLGSPVASQRTFVVS